MCNATDNSLNHDLLSSSGVSGGELRMAASPTSTIKAAPSNVEACTDKANAKKPHPSLSKSSTAKGQLNSE